MRVPGGVPSAHQDTFPRRMLPPAELWPVLDYSAPHLAHYPDRLNGCAALLDSAVAAGFGSKPVFHFEDGTFTFAHLLDRVQRIARVLVEEYGLVPGNRVLLRTTNNPMAAACWLAVVRAGGVCVTTMPLLRARELGYIVDKAEIAVALCEASLAEEMEATRAQNPGLRHVGYFSPLGLGRDPGAGLDRAAEGKPASFAPVDTAADDVALITFTSGTTGSPKGAMHFHRDLVAVCDCWPLHYPVDPDDVVCGSPSFAFTYGLCAFLLYPLRHRAAAVLVPRPTPELILEAVGRHRVTSLYSVPTLYQSMCRDVGRYDLSSLRKCTSAGEHLRPNVWTAWNEATGHRIVNGLGMSELLTHFISESLAVDRVGSTGRAVSGYTVRVLDEEFNPLPPGNRGRLAVRGPTGCRYLDDADRQQGMVKNGWNLTGDVTEQDKDGWFWYVDRADDMIISSGYNISASEVEQVVANHPKVQECAVIGVPHPERGNVVRACVVLKDGYWPGDDLVREIQDFVKTTIAPYKYPRDVVFLETLPRTATGKIQRFRLRQM